MTMSKYITLVVVAVVAFTAVGAQAQTIAWPWLVGPSHGTLLDQVPDSMGNEWTYGTCTEPSATVTPALAQWWDGQNVSWDTASTATYEAQGMPPHDATARWSDTASGTDAGSAVIIEYPTNQVPARPSIYSANFNTSYKIRVAAAGTYDITGVMSNYSGDEVQVRIGAYDASTTNYVEVINANYMASANTLDFDDPANDAAVDIEAGGYLVMGFYNVNAGNWQAQVMDDVSLSFTAAGVPGMSIYLK